LFCAGVIFFAGENRTYLWKYSLPAFSCRHRTTLIISLYSHAPNSDNIESRDSPIEKEGRGKRTSAINSISRITEEYIINLYIIYELIRTTHGDVTYASKQCVN